jgi:hypothetical protein
MTKTPAANTLNSLNRYRPSLSELLQLCATNYALLMRLFVKDAPQAEVKGNQYDFFISEQLSYCLTIKEVTRYTTLINLRQQVNKAPYSDILAPTMLVRLYHDARMAEVNASQHIHYVKPRYDYPNDNMHYPDEKQQINQFLKEWLQLCLQQGQVKVSRLATPKNSTGKNTNE